MSIYYMFDFTIPGIVDIDCKLFLYNENFFPIPVVIYYFFDDDLDSNINFCKELSTQSACHVIMMTNITLVNYKQLTIRLIDFVYLDMHVDISNIILLGRRWATSAISYTLYYCKAMYDVSPYSLIFIYPERHNVDKVKQYLSYCKSTVALFIDDENHEYSEELKEYINSISKLDYPTFTNYTNTNTDIIKNMIVPCRYVIRPIYVKPGTKYKLPSNIKFTRFEINNIKQPKYKEYINKISNKYAEMKKMLS